MEDTVQSLSTGVQSLDTIVTLSSDQRRRYVVGVLAERDSPMAFDELVTAVASLERETDPDAVSVETFDEVATTLHHCHLPKLDDANIIDYDTATSDVKSARPEVLTSILETVRRR